MNNSPERVHRIEVASINDILGIPFKVLDDGFVRVVDYMGSDESIVQAARVSYGKGTKKVNEDKALIRYLMRHDHTTPFEMCEIKFHVRVPMDCWRQWIRHRTASVNEYSTRYSLAIDSTQKTGPSEWRLQATINKQGSDAFLDKLKGEALSLEENELHEQVKRIYQKRIEKGIAREQARKDLPLSTYTESYWKIDLHNLLHFLRLRMDNHAQTEIRNYATIIGEEIVKRWCPITWEAFVEYKLNGLYFSERELLVMASIQSKKSKMEIQEQLVNLGFLLKSDPLKSTRELSEFENKLIKYGFSLAWK